jgi:hypothetical protein
MADPIVKLTVEDSSFNAKIQAAAKSFADFGKNVANAGVDAFGKFARGVETASGAFKSFNAVLKANALVFVATTAIQAGSAIADLVSDWITGASEAEEAQRKLNEEIEETIKKVKALDEESNFNVRIAKAMGKSTADILQMKLDNAIQRRNELQNAALNPSIQAGTEAWNSLNKEIEIYDKQIKKIKQDIEVNKTAQEYHTGEYSVRGGGGGGGRSGGDGPSMPKNIRWDNYADKAAMVKPEDFIAPPSVWEQYAEGIRGTFDSIGDDMSNLTKWTKNFDPIREMLDKQNKLLQEQQTRYNLAGQAAQNFGSALAGLDDPAAKAAGTVIQAISSIALGFAMASSNANTAGTGWGWLAWLAAGTAAMATTISTIHSLTGYAEGGIVKGNSYSGDNVGGLVDGSQLVGLNAGELVLTKAMQSNLASQLSNGGQTIRVVGKLHGKDLFICAENWSKSAGHGEFVTW